jgi:hypothetical protein
LWDARVSPAQPERRGAAPGKQRDEENSGEAQHVAEILKLSARPMFIQGQFKQTNLPRENTAMTTSIISYTVSAVASVIPGFLISPHDPAAIFGFLIVGACVLFAAREYVMPRRLTRHGLRV